MHVLVTGAAGSIGSRVSAGLAERGHRVRALDRVSAPAELESAVAEWRVGDCLDPAAVDRAVAGVDAVVHLASNPLEAGLAECLESHVHTTGRLLDAMVVHDVGRMVYASSNHAVGRTPRDGRLGADVPPRPDTFYGVAKVAAEALLQLHADRYAMRTFALRIGSFLERPETRRGLCTWLSPADGVRMVHACLTAPAAAAASRTGNHTVLYGISANTRGWWDLAPGHAVGYSPVDDAEDFADRVPGRPEDAAEAGVVGGPLAGQSHERPAFDPGGSR